MKYNKTQKRFDLGLGLNFRIVEENGKLAVRSNIPALDMKVLTATTMHGALSEIESILWDNFDDEGNEYCYKGMSHGSVIQQNNIKELL